MLGFDRGPRARLVITPNEPPSLNKEFTYLLTTLEASEIFFSLHMIFSLERAAVVWAILERISGFEPSLEMTDHRYLKFFISSSL